MKLQQGSHPGRSVEPPSPFKLGRRFKQLRLGGSCAIYLLFDELIGSRNDVWSHQCLSIKRCSNAEEASETDSPSTSP
jgi:hypothetical protein